MKIRIVVFTGNRSEYGLMKTLIGKINKDLDFDLFLIASGTHFNSNFGETINEIFEDFEERNKIISIKNEYKEVDEMGFKTAEIIRSVTSVLKKIKPEYFVVLGDRYESFAAAAAAHILGIKNVHLHGGETSLGAIDEKLRHAISQLSCFHFTSAEPHKKKVESMVGTSSNVYNIGPLVLDGLENLKIISKKEFEMKTGFVFSNINVLVTFHPETLSKDFGISGFKNLLNVLDKFDCSILFTAPNPDNGYKMIIENIKSSIKKNPKKYLYIPSLGHDMYLNALHFFDFVIGNSSSGIIEAPLLKTTVLNIGDRQKGRYRFGPVIDVVNDFDSISEAVAKMFKSLNKNPRDSLTDLKDLKFKDSPSNQIINILKKYSSS